MSNVFAIKKLSRFTKSNVIRTVQYHSFHGVGYRDLVKKTWSPAMYGAASIDPLHIVHDGNHIPPIVQPAREYIVSDQVKRLLQPFPGIRFVETVFDKLVDFYFAKGDFSFYKDAPDVDPRDLLLEAPDVPRWKETVGKYYEAVVPRHVDVVGNYADGVELRFSNEGKVDASDAPILKLSDKLFHDYSVIWYEGWHIMRPDLFQTLEPFFDFDFFVKERIDF